MPAERGFTLLELLVVLTVLALVSGLAATAYGGRSARQQDRDFAAVSQHLDRVRAQALVSGSMVGTGIGDSTEGAGRGVPAGTPTALPASLRSLRLDWRPLGGAAAGRGLAYFPDGSATPGVLEFGTTGSSQQITFDWTGRFTHVPDNR